MACYLLVRQLLACRLDMVFSHGRQFLWPWGCPHATGAVKTYPVVNRAVIYNGAVNIGIMDYRSVYVHHCGVITEMATRPHPAAKAEAAVAKAIINTTVKTYVRAPVAPMVTIMAAFISPV